MDVLNEIKALGCSNNANIMMAYQTYLELTRMENYTDVTYDYDNEFDLIYLKGRKNDTQSVFVPVHSSFTMSLTWIRTVRSKLCDDEEKSIVLVIREADSSSVRYKLSEGLIMPPTESNRFLRKGSGKSRKKQKLTQRQTDSTIAAE